MSESLSGLDWLSSSSVLLSVWMLALLLALTGAVILCFVPKSAEKIRRGLFFALVIPAILVPLAYAIRGFHLLDRPTVHWVFQKTAIDGLRLGIFFDPVSFVLSVGFAFTLGAIVFRNRTPVRLTSSLVISWVGLCLVASSKTLWVAAIGLGIQTAARQLPILAGTESETTTDDGLWMATTKRAWISLFFILAGGAGIASQGIHLDFSQLNSFGEATSSLSFLVSAALFGAGFICLLAPAFSAHALHAESQSTFEEDQFIFESASSWSAVIVLYRMLPAIAETSWGLALSISATVLLLFSVLTGVFLESKRRSIHLWLASIPLMLTTILPFLHAQQAFLWLTGSALAFSGLFLTLDHERKTLEKVIATFFFLGIFGFFGWSTSSGVTEFFSRIESLPLLCGSVFFVWLLFAAVGFRLVLRGGESSARSHLVPSWIALGVMALLGFGPLLSGRWSGGGLPEKVDFLDGAEEWPWILGVSTENSGGSWLGFGLGHGILILAILVGTFVAAKAGLFPFAEKYPKGKKAAQRMFGFAWFPEISATAIVRTGSLLAVFSDLVWEKYIPKTVRALFHGLKRAGDKAESWVDGLTSENYGKLFSAPSKLVQWLHGGNVRLYAWFTLVWVLIFSVYLTR
ncbi:MAG: hypothetical protein H7301_14165 [Cryobacterium sp.]|nr:hypothetical protein [Oligoflexia bacterium]